MLVDGKPTRTIWTAEDGRVVRVIDQRLLPHRFVVEDLRTAADMERAIRDMLVRGAPLIGAAAAYGMHLACLTETESPGLDARLEEAGRRLKATRPTAVNLSWAVDRQLEAVRAAATLAEKRRAARGLADRIAEEEVAMARRIGEHGARLIEEIARRKGGKPVQVLTHCNAGWLCSVDIGTATAPIYEAHARGVPVFVWVDETRPWNQGARLTAWEMLNNKVPHAVIADNAGGHLMQHGMVDLVIVGADRVTRTGDVANKIGTYLKALAAKDNGVPFHVALSTPAFDWTLRDGVREIPIEERGAEEVRYAWGLADDGEVRRVLLTPEGSPASNHGFDVTPARLVSGLITERGLMPASEDGILALYPERRAAGTPS